MRNINNISEKKMNTIFQVGLIVLFFNISTIPIVNADDLAGLALEDLMDVSLTSITRMETQLSSSPVSAYVVSQNEINKKGYRYLIDILKNTPGFYIVENSLVEKGATEIYIRGVLSNSKMLILIDGHRIKPATGEPMSFFSSMPLLNIKQVEISLGTGSSLYGADAMSATINLVTFDGQETDGVRTKITAGNRDTGEIQFSAGKSINKNISVALSGSFQHTAGEDFDDTYPNEYGGLSKKPDMEENDYSVHFRADIDKLTVSYYRVETKHNSGLGLNPDIYDVSGDSYLRISNQLATASYEWDINPFLKMQTQFAYENTYLDPSSKYTFTFPGSDEIMRHVTWNSASTRVTQNIAYQKGDLHWIAGFEFMHLSSSPKKDIEQPFGEYHSSYENYAGYTQVQYELLDNLTVTAGMRLDYDTRYDEEFNPRIGFSWKPSNSLRFFGSWGTSYLSPSPYLIYERFNEKPPAGEIGFYKRPNENLDSEHMMTYEMGTEWQPSSHHKVKLVGFFSYAEDLIRQVNRTKLGLPSINDNNDEHKIYGFELSTNSQLFEHLFLDIAYTMTMGKKDAGQFSNGTSKLSHVPVNLIHGSVLYDYQDWTLRVSGRWFDHVYTHPKNSIYHGDAANGTLTFDANLHYKYKLDQYLFDIDFSVDNIFDEKYYKISTIDGSFVGFADTPQESRRFSMTLGLSFDGL